MMQDLEPFTKFDTFLIRKGQLATMVPEMNVKISNAILIFIETTSARIYVLSYLQLF